MRTLLRPCITPVLAAALAGLPVPAAASVNATYPDVARRTPPVPASQRLAWRVTELEGELAVLQRFAQQQDASLHQMQSALDASEDRQARENLMLAAMWALVSAWAAWRVVRRPRC